MAAKSAKLAEHLRQGFVGPLSEKETEFLRDVQGFLEFAIRNGLSFPIIMASLDHDFNPLFRNGFDLSALSAEGFLPKVTGYSKVTADDVGDSEDSDA